MLGRWGKKATRSEVATMRSSLVLFLIVLWGATAAEAQVYSMGSAQCSVNAISGFVICSGQQTSYVQKPLHEVLLETAASVSSVERDRAIAAAMRAQADLLRTQAEQQSKAAAMDRVVTLLASAEKLEGETRAALLGVVAEELRKLYPARNYPAGSVVLVPMSSDGWDRMACERLKLQLGNVHLFAGTFADATTLEGVKLLVVNMTPDMNHDSLEAFLIDERGSRVWAEKVGFAFTLNFERQTTKLADRLAKRVKNRL